MNKRYAFTDANNEITVTLPSMKNCYLLPGSNSYEPWTIKSKENSVKILDHTKKQVGYMQPNQIKSIMVAKPKWYQVIKIIRGKYKWIIE